MSAEQDPPKMPTTVDGMMAYLASKGMRYSQVEQLTGGMGNYLFRVIDDRELSSIYKHAEPYIASSNGTIPFSVARMDFEATAMTKLPDIIPTFLPEVRNVHVPTIMNYDQMAKVLVMTDAGRTTLKEAYTDPATDVPEIGRQLGEWLAALHVATQNIEIGEGGNPTARSIYRWAYSHLPHVANQYGLNADFCEYINNVYGLSLGHDDECVCHGDFWPGNIMLDEEKNLTVIDWEMCRRGRGELDVAQFAAEAYLLDRFRGGKGLMDSFCKSYRRSLAKVWGDITIDRRWARRFGVHIGVHLAFWPASVEWADRDETKAVIELGHELMRRGDAEDLDWMSKNVLGALFNRDS
ncbi:MAG: hypothetical protein LQ337_007466 [Flavoplaca oasis]|nr:MAG: hypothetical protein LQ337_007466 [Flavoplaca oasis]